MSYQKPEFKNQYQNFIGGQWIAPEQGKYFDDISPVDGKSSHKLPAREVRISTRLLQPLKKRQPHGRKPRLLNAVSCC